jgi:GH43 family beta-xylosidase
MPNVDTNADTTVLLMRNLFHALTAAVILLLSGCSHAPDPTAGAGPAPECTFTNPIGPGQDPWIVRHEGAYHLVESREGGIYVYRSDRLTDPKRNPVRVWTAPDTGWNQASLWAPELHFIDGRWYIYYAAGRPGPRGAPFIHQRSGVLQSVGNDPQGEYVDRGMLYTGDDIQTGADNKWAIDLTVTRLDGQLYAAWSGWERNTTVGRTPQHLYMARMSNPYTISSNRVKISSPTESWEVKEDPDEGLDLQEGPEFLRNGDRLFLIYSTRESWLKDYRLGQLRLRSPQADPMDPASWIKSGPVFLPTETVHGVGHGGFTVSPDGTENWHVYHAKVDTEPGWNRVLRMQPFTWKADGSPDFGRPTPSGQPIPVPSGQCK